jgi:hypothetical protein
VCVVLWWATRLGPRGVLLLTAVVCDAGFFCSLLCRLAAVRAPCTHAPALALTAAWYRLHLTWHLQVLARLGVRRLVVGHTPQAPGRAAARCGGRLLLLDTGMSSGMLGSPAAAWVCHPGVILNLQPLDADGDAAEGSLTAVVENVGPSGSGASSQLAGSQAGDAALSSIGASSGGGSSRSGEEARGREGYSVVAYADGTVAAV